MSGEADDETAETYERKGSLGENEKSASNNRQLSSAAMLDRLTAEINEVSSEVLTYFSPRTPLIARQERMRAKSDSNTNAPALNGRQRRGVSRVLP